MNFLKKQFVIAFILVLAFSALSAGIPLMHAAGQQVDTYAYISATPSTIGVNQEATILIWLNHAPPTAAGPKGDRWEDLKVEITDPEGITSTKGPYTTDDVGAAWFAYTPTKVGKYYLQMTFPGQTLTGVPGNENDPNVGDYYKPSTSRRVELTVQQNPVSFMPTVEAPDYWQRPIYAENRELWNLGSNWLMASYDTTSRSFDAGSAVAVDNKAPNSAHILWTRPLTFGGLIGAEQPTVAYYQGLSYETMFTPPLVISGRLYYNTPTAPRYGFYCVDLQTGETIYYANVSKPYTRAPNEGGQFPGVLPLSFGQIYDYESPNQHGGVAYLWCQVGSTWSMYDAWTGNWILDIEKVPSGTIAFGPSGELMVYALDGANNRLIAWNSSKAIPPPWFTGSGFWQWRPDLYQGQTLDGLVGIQYNVTVPDEPGSQALREVSGDVIYAQSGDLWIAYNKLTGAKLWSATLNRPEYPPGLYRGGATTMTPYRIHNGVYAEFIRETMQWYGYDVQTGQLKWGPTDPYESDWGYYNGYTGRIGAYNNIYTAGYDGTVRAYNIETGNLAWSYYAGDAGFETPYGTWPFYGGLVIADGKVFAATGEHSPGTPLWKGEKLHVMDAYTGAPMWKISGWFQANSLVVADGKLVGLNGYDNQIYCFGKGPTATTVTAPLTAVSKGQAFMITGSVTDQSPGQEGTPAMSDASMSAWMEYLHMQKPKPTDAVGVQVKLTAVGSNGNTQDIGIATSDSNGNYGIMWTPAVEGQYKIVATFEGTASYGGSDATTYLGVGSAAAASPSVAPGPEATPSTDVYIIAAAAVIIVVVAAAAVFLRKRK